MEKTTLIAMIKLWKCDPSLGRSPFSASSTVPRGEGKNDVECHFPSRFSNYFRIPLCGGLKFGEQVGWALFSSFGLWARWMAFGPFSPVWSTVDHQCCWALGLWWTTGVLNLVRGGLKK
jgi:hypothetical protein